MELDSGVKEYLRSLQASIENQESTIESLRAKNKRLEEQLQSAEDKVEELTKEITDLKDQLLTNAKPMSDEPLSITEEITKAAQDVVKEQFLQSLVYEETSGLYYDYKSGYYYDAAKEMYYDGEKGVYLAYNSATGEYVAQSNDDSDQGMSSRSSSPETIPEASSADLAKVQDESSKKEPRELSDGEISSPSPPPSPPTKKKRRPKKGGKKDYDQLYYDDKKSLKQRKKEMRIPCIRIVIHAAPDKSSVQAGSLFIVTCKGGTIGREGNHDVLLDDIACSKDHGWINFDESESKYFLTDKSSRNGTFIDGQRLKSNVQREIGHGTLIRIGTTQMICHVHPGLETCLKCEPGVVISSQPKLNSYESSKDKELKRKSELKQIRKKYGIGSDHQAEASADISKNGYTDRAGDRRKTKGSDNPYEKTQAASTEESISKDNKGFKLLQKMGWQDGKGLGKDSKGRTEPVKVEERAERQGLGAEASFAGGAAFNNQKMKQQQKRLEMIRKTQERFSKLS